MKGESNIIDSAAGIKSEKVKELAYLIDGLMESVLIMDKIIMTWTQDEWKNTWPGEYERELEIIPRQWVIWYLIEYDLRHGEEISLLMGQSGKNGNVI